MGYSEFNSRTEWILKSAKGEAKQVQNDVLLSKGEKLRIDGCKSDKDWVIMKEWRR
jgi:hypothetical protein